MGKKIHSVQKEKEGLIFNAALRVIKKRGFHKARMSDIAKEAGISYGLVYHYFKNKEDLFDNILNRWWEGLFQLMEEVLENEQSVYERLRRIILYFFDTYQNHPELVNIFITEISRSTSNLTRIRLEHFIKFMKLTDSLMENGQKQNLLRKDIKARYLTYIFLGAMETFITAMVLVDQQIGGDDQKRRIAESILEVFLNGAKKSD
jgi:TetR/AcrR family fatty acid metabolism transcriptional regulator